MELEFANPVIEWRGPAPFFYVALPEWAGEQIDSVARAATYGWGVIPVEVDIGSTTFTTSLFPKDGGYLLPVKAAVRTAEGLSLGDTADVVLRVTGL